MSKYEQVAERIVTSGGYWTMHIQGQDVTELAIKQIAKVLEEEFAPPVTQGVRG